MTFTIRSKEFQELYRPTQIGYSCLLMDADIESNDYESYDKVIIVSPNASNIEISGFQKTVSHQSSKGHISVLQKPTLSCDITFVIQGPDTALTRHVIVYSALYGDISLGIWSDDLTYVEQMVKTQELDNYYNKFFQTTSTLKGLLSVETQYAIKIRSDEYFVNYTDFLCKLRQLPSYQILTSNIYFHKINTWPYHISDHLMGAHTSALKLMFVSSYKNILNKNPKLKGITPEVHLALSYLLNMQDTGPEERNFQVVAPLMLTFFDVYPVQQFEEYTLKHQGVYFTKKDKIPSGYLLTEQH